MGSTTTAGIAAKAWEPRTHAECNAVREQLDRILGSSAFRNSKRYPTLLKFLVEETIEGRGDNLKERVVGVEVFGREPAYDTGGDHVVRTSAGEVRKRLAQYYLDAGRDDEIRIDIPTGSYSAQFRLASEVVSATPVATVPLPPIEIPVRALKWYEIRPALLISIAANVVLAIALIVTVAIADRWGTDASTLEKFWDPVFASPDPIQLVVGLRDGGGPGQAENGANANWQNANAASVPLDPLLHRMAMAEVLALTRITRYAGEKHANFRVLDPSSTSFSDLRHEPTVLIGAGNNAWTKQIATKLRFGFQLPTGQALRPIAVSDRQNPSNNKWARTYGPSGEDVKDYALVSRLVDPRVEQVVVIIGGLGAHGTEIAGEFVTNPEQMKKLDAFAPSGWEHKNVQIVLSTEVINGSSGPPKIEATYFW